MGFTRLGLIAGGGDLPRHVAEACGSEGRLGCVIALRGWAEPADFPGAVSRGLGQIGHVIDDLKAAGCDAVCFAGIVKRPDFKALIPDWAGVKLLPRFIAAAAQGDDALLRLVIATFEDAGFSVVGAQEITHDLLARPGPVGRVSPDESQRADIDKAMRIAAEMGQLDIGQGAVVCDGLVLAVEAQEGTDAMLARVAGLPAAIRGTAANRRGVLVKRPKPTQELRVDIPVIGVSTVDHAARAGLAGIAIPAEGAFILGYKSVAERADANGIFVFVLPAEAGEVAS